MKSMLLNCLITFYVMFFVSLLAICALGFAVAGIYLWLVQTLAVWAAALTTAGIVLLVALVILMIARLVTGSPGKTGTPKGRREADPETLGLMAEILKQANFDARDATLVALLAGTALGASPELRDQVFAVFASHYRRDGN